MLRQFSGNERKYLLPLSDGLTWEFRAAESMTTWLKDFSYIMQISRASDDMNEADKKLLFLALKHDNKLPETDSTEDWNQFKQGAVYRVWSHNHKPETFIELNSDFIHHQEIKIINMSTSLKPIYKHYTLHNRGGPIHAALAELNGKGILIAAHGGTGKSTCSIRFPNYWTPLSDDMSLIVSDSDSNYRVHPMPTWSDHLWNKKMSTFNTSYSVPLKAIFFLEQSDVDEILPIRNPQNSQKIFDSFKQVWESFWPKIDVTEKKIMVHKIFNNAFDISCKIPCYKLKATLHGEFWKEIEKAI
ncbi:MAG TPA: SynChlorMet cassette protein ScmC [Victivallales bacterium]|nr:SynChlorMet cassette protein ScmC [Victivallales bacterium]